MGGPGFDTCPFLSSRQDYERGSLYGLEKFWAFHHYGGLPKDAGVEINAKVREGK